MHLHEHNVPRLRELQFPESAVSFNNRKATENINTVTHTVAAIGRYLLYECKMLDQSLRQLLKVFRGAF